MNTSNLKRYAPKARRDFIAAVSKQAAKYGVTKDKVHPVEVTGDVAVINGKPFPAKLAPQIKKLGQKVQSLGYDQTMEQVAYSWFNRLIAIRYMELHGYLDHGRRVLSHPDHKNGFQILDECTDISYGEGGQLPHLTHEKVVELKLDGTKDEELYRELLLAQCHALHTAMPFLFETVDDETELLLPENLTKTDSLVKEMVKDVPEEDWKDVEVVGWLYQFYISEKKEEVIGSILKKEDIPAATQIFTPNWVVKYLVENSIGRQWLEANEGSSIKNQLEFYIPPSDQPEQINLLLGEISSKPIEPLELKIIDPACGSGHILVEAYKLLRKIYEERGFRKRDIPSLILEKNIYGLDIDDRAAQLAGFALMMLARNDDRRIFNRDINLNILSIQETNGIALEQLLKNIDLNRFNNIQIETLEHIWECFEYGKDLGSLVNIETKYEPTLQEIITILRTLEGTGDLFESKTAEILIPFVKQALFLSKRYDFVLANPPYMGSKFYNPILKRFVNNYYSDEKADLYSVFIEKNLILAKDNSYVGMITIPNWMFLSSFKQLREKLLNSSYIDSMVHNGRGVWGSDFGSCSFVIRKLKALDAIGSYKRLFIKQGSVASNSELIERFKSWDNHFACSNDFLRVPESPIAYWIDESAINSFSAQVSLGDMATTRVGLATGDNDRFVRFWFEVNISNIGFSHTRETAKSSNIKWFPYANGGEARKWYGNYLHIVDWLNDGNVLQTEKHVSGRIRAHNFNLDKIFKPGLTWSLINVSYTAIRELPPGFLFSSGAPSLFTDDLSDIKTICGYYNSSSSKYLLDAINPTVNNNSGDADKLPYPFSKDDKEDISALVDKAISISKMDWNESETSWGFEKHPLISDENNMSIEDAFNSLSDIWDTRISDLKAIEEQINNKISSTLGLNNTVSEKIPYREITLRCNPLFRYGSNDTGLKERIASDTFSELISYSIGCILGRYALDAIGIFHADATKQLSPTLETEKSADHYLIDDDGIIPLTSQEWFEDDVTNRFIDFVEFTWGQERVDSNIKFIAKSLCLDSIKPKKGEDSSDTIRRYLSTQFYKDHCKTYKKRPIYWLFSSGKQKAFECLVYIHRYNEGTLSRMRTEYVIPLTSKIASHVEKLEKDKEASESAAESKRIEKEIALLHKQQAELAEFDEKLKHFADQRIKLNLDDGVKENYGKFGDLLADVKAIHGKAV